MLNRSNARWSLLLLGLLVCPSPVLSQQAQDQTPIFSSRVELVRLHVRAQRGDEFVSGLTADDFRLYVNGVERIPEWVEEIDLSNPTLSDADARPDARRRFVVLMDAVFQRPEKLEITRLAALEFLRDMARPGDLAALAVMGHRGLSLLQPFTDDMQLIERRLRAVRTEWTWQIGGAQGNAGFYIDPYNYPLQRRRPAGIPQGYELVPDLIPESAPSFVNLLGINLAGLRELGVGLQALDGRKHLLMYSQGFSSFLLGVTNLQGVPDRIAANSPLLMDINYFGRSLRGVFRLAAEALRDADTAVHAMSTERLSLRGRRIGMDSLWYLSESTNGSMQFHTHHLEDATARVDRKTRQYYSLAYQRRLEDPPRVNLEVKVTTRGVRIEAPTRLVLPPARSRMNPLQQQLKTAEEAAILGSEPHTR